VPRSHLPKKKMQVSFRKNKCHVAVFFVKNRPANHFVTTVARMYKLCDRLV
jgi:hypothetical protein